MQLSRTGKKWISVIVAIRPVFPDPVTFVNTACTTQYKTPPISSFPMWMQAWNTYFTIVLTHNPTRALELVGYHQIITSTSLSLPLHAWLKYDGQFRTMAVCNPHLRWDQRHTDLWHEPMTSVTGTRRWPCPYCGARTHFPDNCPRSPFRDSTQQARPSNRRDSGPPICGDYNNDRCT